MTLATPLAVPLERSLPRTAGTGRPALVSRGRISPLATFTRSQVSAFSTARGADGATFREFAADVPRFNGTAQRLLIEGQRTNLIANPRTPGGTGWTLQNITSATSITGPDGVSGSAVTLTEDTATAAHVTLPGSISFITSQTYVITAIARAGSRQFLQITASLIAATVNGFANFDLVNGTLGAAGSAVTRHAIRPLGGGWYWCEMGFTSADAVAGAPIFCMQNSGSATRLAAYTGTSATLDLFWTQIEAGAVFASSIILPPSGAPGASTRGQDNLTAPLATLSPTGVGTVLGSFMIPQSAPASADQMLFEINDGSVNNRIRLRNVAGGNTLVAGRVTAGTPVDATTIGSMTPGTLFRVGLTFDGSNIVANFNGGTNQTVAGIPPGLTTFRVGNSVAGTTALFGEVGTLTALPTVIPAGDLPAAVLAVS